VTLGLCSQRELDALVAKAAKAAGIEQPQTDTRLDGDREVLLEQLRRERETAARDADAALGTEAAEPGPRDFDSYFKS